MPITMMRTTAIAAILALPLTGTAFAQQSGGTEQAQEATGQAGQTTAQADSGSTSGPPAEGDQADTLVATVGDAEIRGSDVMTVIGMLPPRMQSQPPQMLVPIALEQLILRELILEQARAANLAQDPEVVALVEGSARGAEDDAMVQVWVDRELVDAVTDAEVERIYGTLQPQGQQPVPPMSELRPQIEQHLRQQAMQEIRDRLRADAEVVFYDPSGQPIRQGQMPQAQDGATAGSGEEMRSGQDTGAAIEGTQSTIGETSPGGEAGAETNPGRQTGD